MVDGDSNFVDLGGETIIFYYFVYENLSVNISINKCIIIFLKIFCKNMKLMDLYFVEVHEVECQLCWYFRGETTTFTVLTTKIQVLTYLRTIVGTSI